MYPFDYDDFNGESAKRHVSIFKIKNKKFHALSLVLSAGENFNIMIGLCFHPFFFITFHKSANFNVEVNFKIFVNST